MTEGELEKWISFPPSATEQALIREFLTYLSNKGIVLVDYETMHPLQSWDEIDTFFSSRSSANYETWQKMVRRIDGETPGP